MIQLMFYFSFILQIQVMQTESSLTCHYFKWNVHVTVQVRDNVAYFSKYTEMTIQIIKTSSKIKTTYRQLMDQLSDWLSQQKTNQQASWLCNQPTDSQLIDSFKIPQYNNSDLPCIIHFRKNRKCCQASLEIKIKS